MTDPINRADAPEPCPFCRSPAKTQELVEDLWVVWCVECKAQMENFATEAEAIAAWNTRALPAIDPAAIREAALREAYEVVYKWWFGDGNALPQELILALIGEKK